ncbi:uncharacterized protein LOC133555680 [Nerophis ophidion]|uniref:uncharacterized protein LOC133547971 n=1 Tax=Nerophis ophidion TaxID=159077 RepID=UPI002ADF39CE|nr:uncharacterized protein LOC133547971 [Nerophis ophidion]XP_061760992.1 uncharacterized protein LOC133555680 [Nerophis ophidion]
MDEGVNQHAPLHRDLGKTQMKRDAGAVKLALQWFEENNPFETWQDIANSYLRYLQNLGRNCQKIIVVFDGYNRLPKDHDHIRRTKKACCDLQIRGDLIHWTPRAKFLDKCHNKSELYHLLSSTFRKLSITVVQSDNDVNTFIVGEALAAATDGSVEVRAEDADVLVMLTHHSSSTKYPLFFTTLKGSYDVRRIREVLSEKQRRYLVFCHVFTGCDTVSAIAGHGKTILFDRFCAGDIDEHMDIFLDIRATKDAVIQTGTAIFHYIYHGPGSTLGKVRYNIFLGKAAAGLIKPETLPPTEGAAAHHSLRVYQQTRNWLLLQSMSLDPNDYGWTIGVHGYEPVPTLDPMAPEELLQFTSWNYHGDCSSRRCSYKKNSVKCISACGVCQGITCKNAIHGDGIL